MRERAVFIQLRGLEQLKFRRTQAVGHWPVGRNSGFCNNATVAARKTNVSGGRRSL